MTLDWWRSREAYDAFRAEHAEEYAELDRQCALLTTSEEKLGELVVVV